MKNRKVSYLKEFIGMFKPYRVLFLVIFLIAIIHQTMTLVYPWLARIVMDEVISGKSALSLYERQRILLNIGSVILILAFGIGVMSFLRGNLLAKLLLRLVFDLRQQLNWHLQKLSLSFFSRQKTGRLVSRIINDINQASVLISQGAINVVLDTVFILVIIVILLKISPLLTCLSLIILPIYVIIFHKLSPRLRHASKDIQRHVAIMSGNIQERLSGISVIQSFAAEEHEHGQFTEDNETYIRKMLKRRNIHLYLSSTSITINHLSNGIILAVGGCLALSGKLSPGDVLAFILYVAQVYAPLGRLSEVNVQIQQALGSLERVFDIFRITPEIKNLPNAVKQIKGNGRLSFENVGFCYEKGRPILHEINLDIASGTKVAVIGPSGAGKTTLAALVPRLYDVAGGRIVIGSVDIRKVDLTALRQAIGIVQQEPFLFSTTIRENILYGRRNATMDEIINATEAAHAHDFIKNLTKGYESVLGERGVNLSMGQRQRICLARTILKDPKILILDEATSSLDSESENLIHQALEGLMKNRTSLIIAHRLSTIINADFVIVLNEGRIVERGTHTELWNKKGFYTVLLEQQFGPLKDLMEKSKSI